MPDSMNPVKLRLIPYNARLLDARKDRGLTQKHMYLLTGISTSYLGHIETLRVIPTQHVMDEISAALDLPQDYLFPESLMEAIREGLFDHRVAELEEQQIIKLTEGRRARLLSPHITDEEMIHAADQFFLKKRLAEALTELSPREHKVLELRFGLDGGGERTLKQVAEHFGVFPERARQIEAKALRKLRHPLRSRKLKDFLD